jgi:hypothetical protein
MKKAQITLLAVLTLAIAATVACSGASSAKSTVPTYTQLAYVSDQTVSPATSLFLMNLDGTNVAPVPFGTDVNSPSASANLNTIAFDSDENVWVSNVSGSTQTQLTNTTGSTYVYSVRVSPDGTKLVYGQGDESTETGDIWLVNADGSNPVNLSSSATDVYCYSGNFSADGTQVVFMCVNDNTNAISLNTVNVDGTGLTTVFSSNATYCTDWCDTPAFSADGTQILFTSADVPQSAARPHQPMALSRPAIHGLRKRPGHKDPSTGWGIVSIAVSGGNTTVINSTGAYELTVLNSTLFYTQYDSTTDEDQIFSSNLDGSSPVQITTGDYYSALGLNVD